MQLCMLLGTLATIASKHCLEYMLLSAQPGVIYESLTQIKIFENVANAIIQFREFLINVQIRQPSSNVPFCASGYRGLWNIWSSCWPYHSLGNLTNV